MFVLILEQLVPCSRSPCLYQNLGVFSLLFPLTVSESPVSQTGLWVYLELIFVSGERQESSVIYAQVDFQFSQHRLLKRLSLSFLQYVFFPSLKSGNHSYVALHLGLLCHSIDPCVCFCVSTTLSSLVTL